MSGFLWRAWVVVVVFCAVAVFGSETTSPEPAASAEPSWVEAGGGVRWRDVSLGRGRSPERGDKVFLHIDTYLDGGPRFHTTRGSRLPVGYFYGDGQMPSGFDAAIATLREGGRRQIEFSPEFEYRTRAHLSEEDQFSTSSLVRLDVVLLWVEPARGHDRATTSTSGGGETR